MMNRKNINNFTFDISSDPDYEEMVVNLNFGNDLVAILSSDEGLDKVKIEIFNKYDYKTIWSFDYQSFIESLNYAYGRLKKVNEIPNSD